MKMGIIGKSVLLTFLALFCFTSSVSTLRLRVILQLPPAPPTLPSPLVLTIPPLSSLLPPFPPSLPPLPVLTPPPISLPLPRLTQALFKLPTLPAAKAPSKLPTLPPTKAPIKPPGLPPVFPPKYNKTLVAVRGLVYCKPCKYAGVDTLTGAKPVKDALVRLFCKNKKNSITETKTDKNGYFMLLAPKTVTNYDIKGCRATLVKSPDAKCSKVSTLHGGYKGTYLKPVMKPGASSINKLPYGLYNVGPFAFEPTCPK